jgi:precorrin-6B methylase 2
LKHADLVALIEDGVLPIHGEVARSAGRAAPGGRWADLGAGEGAFTLALADLLGPGAHITAIDKDERALKSIKDRFAVSER